MWKDIQNWENSYQVNEIGEVKSLTKKVGCRIRGELILSPKINHYGYKVLRLWKNEKGKDVFVHRLVAEAFIPNPLNKPQVNHIDGNKLNNNVSNLEWVTCSENHKHAFRIGIKSHVGEKHNVAKLTEKDILYIRASEKRNCDLALQFKVSRSNITRIKKRKGWTHI